MNKMNPTAKQFSLSTHPYLLLLAVCLFCAGIFDQTTDTLLSAPTLYCLAVLGVTACGIALFAAFRRPVRRVADFLFPLLAAGGAGYALLLFRTTGHAAFVVGVTLLMELFLLGAYWALTGSLTQKRMLFLIACAAFAVRLAYVLSTDLGVNQHDIGRFAEGVSGHAGYIDWIYRNGKLPDFDVRTKWQFYHPPLHHILEACFLKLQTWLGFSYERACASVQLLPLFYASASTLLGYRLLQALRVRGKTLVAAFALISFHPTFIILAGSYNNDCLALAFMLLATLYAVRWFRNPTYPNILILAAAIGLGMFSKLSAAYVAPAVAMLFLIKLLQEKNILRYLRQYLAFGAVCVPVGLFWSLRNLLGYGVPMTYVPLLASDSEQYIGFRSLAERIFSLPHSLSEGVYLARGAEYGNTFHEYNIPSAVMKTSLFGEWHIGENTAVGTFAANALFWVNVALIVLCAVFFFRFLFSKKGSCKREIRVFLAVLYCCVTVSFVSFCFSYPHDCTMDFRYIVLTLPLSVAMAASSLSPDPNGEAGTSRTLRIARAAFLVGSALFCLLTATLYLAQSYAP